MHSPQDPNAQDQSARELDALMQDKVEAHCRQQLSAMLDGGLAPDEARFLLRRLQHDQELAGNWERWQVYGDLMRGGVSQLLPADFSQRVVSALEAEAQQAQPAVAARGARTGWTRWAGGAALAASVAMAALLVVQRDPQGAVPLSGNGPLEVAATTAPAAVVRAGAVAATNAPEPTPPAAPAAEAGAAAAGAIVLAAREAPRRARRQAARAATPASRAATAVASAPEPDAPASADTAVAAAGTQDASRNNDPFVLELPQNPRPWPRAVVPGTGQGGFNVGYGAQEPVATFEHFEPRLPAVDDPQAELSAQAESTGTP